MYDTGKVLIGVLIFLAAFTSPFWLNIVFGKETVKPVLEYPATEKECIYEKEYMNSYHMDILNEWRDKLVRDDIRMTTINGKETEMSLSRTCMTCHSSKQNFCDKCHDYLGVKPYCWDCHLPPELSQLKDPDNIKDILKDFKKVEDCQEHKKTEEHNCDEHHHNETEGN